jgi:hypothetical protein
MRRSVHFYLTAVFVLAVSTTVLADSNSAECLAAKEASAKVEVKAREDAAKYARYFDAIEGKYLAKFDTEKIMVVMGIVTDFRWADPHAEILLTVSDDPRDPAQRWTVEMSATFILARMGWGPKTLIPGMAVTVRVHPLRDGTNGGQFLMITTHDGKQMDGGHTPTLRSLLDRSTATERTLAQLKQRVACDLSFSAPNPSPIDFQAMFDKLESMARDYRSLFDNFLARYIEVMDSQDLR